MPDPIWYLSRRKGDASECRIEPEHWTSCGPKFCSGRTKTDCNPANGRNRRNFVVRARLGERRLTTPSPKADILGRSVTSSPSGPWMIGDSGSPVCAMSQVATRAARDHRGSTAPCRVRHADRWTSIGNFLGSSHAARRCGQPRFRRQNSSEKMTTRHLCCHSRESGPRVTLSSDRRNQSPGAAISDSGSAPAFAGVRPE
jgi:hypothetical protein